MGNFPQKWSMQSTVGLYVSAVPAAIGKATTEHQFNPPAGLPPAPPIAWHQAPVTTATPSPLRSALSTQDQPVTICQLDIHPSLKQFMARYITHFRSVQWKTLLQTAGLSEQDLPIIPKYIKEGKNGLCYAYVLGKCQGRVCGKYPEGHAPASEVLDKFAVALKQKLAAGVAHRLATDPPTTPQQFTRNPGGNNPKRYTRTA